MSEAEVQFEFGVPFQKNIIRLMLLDFAFCNVASSYLKREYFESKELSWAFYLCSEHFKKYGNKPSREMLEESIRKVEQTVRPVYEAVIRSVLDIPCESTQWVFDEVVAFAKQNEYFKAAQDSSDLWKRDRMGAIDLMHGKLNEIDQIRKEIPQETYLLETFVQRNDRRIESAKNPDAYMFSTGIEPVDNTLGGGLSKGELGLWLAEPKKGKTQALAFHAWYATYHLRKKVAVFALEGAFDQILTRLDTLFLNELHAVVHGGGITHEAALEFYDDVKELQRHMKVRKLSGWNSSTQDIRNILKEWKALEGYVPDLIVIDYLDLLKGPDLKERDWLRSQVGAGRDLKTLAEDDDYAIWSAVQARRPDTAKYKKKDKAYVITSENMGGSFERVRLADFIGSINRTPEEAASEYVRVYPEMYRSNACSGEVYLMKTAYERAMFIDLQGARRGKAISSVRVD